MNIPTFKRKLPNGKISEKKVSIETQLLLKAAEEQGISWRIIPFSEAIELKKNEQVHYLHNRCLDNTSYTGYKYCINKNVTEKMLEDKNISVAPGYFISKEEKEDFGLLENIFDSLNKPLVLKVSRGTHGVGVAIGIKDLETYKKTVFNLLTGTQSDDEGLLIQECFVGEEYRIIVTREKVLAIMNRKPANVTGDGKNTIAELIKEKNKDPSRNIDPNLYPQITLDEEVISILKEQDLSPDSVPNSNQKVTLRKVSNIMAGGDAVDCTDIAHPSVLDIAVQTINALPGLLFVGIDFMTKDITAQQTKDSYCIIEVNGTPEFAMHDIPMIGTPRNVSGTIIEMAFKS